MSKATVPTRRDLRIQAEYEAQRSRYLYNALWSPRRCSYMGTWGYQKHDVYVYTYIYIYIYIFYVDICGSESFLCPMARADKPLLHTLETRSMLHTPCRALWRGYKTLRILMELEGLSRQARTCYIPLVTGYVACVGPGLVTSFGFRPTPIYSMQAPVSFGNQFSHAPDLSPRESTQNLCRELDNVILVMATHHNTPCA